MTHRFQLKSWDRVRRTLLCHGLFTLLRAPRNGAKHSPPSWSSGRPFGHNRTFWHITQFCKLFSRLVWSWAWQIKFYEHMFFVWCLKSPSKVSKIEEWFSEVLHKFKRLLSRAVLKWVNAQFALTLSMVLETMGAADSQSPLRDMVRSTLLHLGLLGGPSGKTERLDISRNFANCFQDWCGLWPDRWNFMNRCYFCLLYTSPSPRD